MQKQTLITNGLKRILAKKNIVGTGEMGQEDIEKGGEWYEARLFLEDVCKRAGVPCTVMPFDNYVGPYAKFKNGGKLYIDEKDQFYYEGPGGKKTANTEDMVKYLSTLFPQPKLVQNKPGEPRDYKNTKLDPQGKREFTRERSIPEERKHLQLIKSALIRVLKNK